MTYSTYYPDTVLKEKNLYCFLIRRYLRMTTSMTGVDLNEGEMADMGLVLTPVPGSNNSFRRTGACIEWSDWNLDEAFAPSIHPHMFHAEGKEQEIEII
jgi:hypothetical protein